MSGDKEDEEVNKMIAKLLSLLDESVAKYISKKSNQDVYDIHWLQGKRIFGNIFTKVIGDLWAIWEIVDGIFEAYASIPDKLREKLKLQ